MDSRRELRAYFALAFGIAWTSVLLLATTTGLPAPANAPPGNRLLVFGAMLAGPSMAGLGLTALFEGRQGLRALAQRLGHWRIGARWYATVAFVPAILLIVLAALSRISSSFVPGLLTSSSPAGTIVFALVAGLGAGLFEEIGWTGFATPRLLARLGWLRAGATLGIIWAVWHGLADYWGGATYGSLWAPHMMEWIVALTAFRILMTWAYHHTGSLLLAVLLHAGSTGAQALLWPAHATPPSELLWYGLFAASLWATVAVVVIRERAPRPRRGSLARAHGSP